MIDPSAVSNLVPSSLRTARERVGATGRDRTARRTTGHHDEARMNGWHASGCQYWRVLSDAELVDQVEQRIVDTAPLSDILRMLLLLGGRMDSAALREWAKSQLEGYPDGTAPDDRTVGAPIYVDAIVGYNRITGQHISASQLPEFARVLQDTIVVPDSIPSLEAKIENARRNDREGISLSIPNWEYIAREIDKDHEFQNITAMYRTVHVTELERIVADSRTRTAELMGEIRKSAQKSKKVPKGKVADQLVHGVIVKGDGNSIVVATGKRSVAGYPSTEPGGGWWEAWGKAASIVTVAVGLLAVAVWIAAAMLGLDIPAP